MRKIKMIADDQELRKGDILEQIDNNTYVFNKSFNNGILAFKLKIEIDQAGIDDLIKEGLAIEVKDNTNVADYINTLINQYTKDYNAMLEAFNNGDVQPCVKVESETVYFNLIKVLKNILDKIDE